MVAALVRMRLIRQGEAPAITALTGGVSSLIVRAETARGTVCVKRALPRLKVAAEWLAPVERNSAELAWMKVAARVAPAFVPRVLGEDRVGRAFAMEFLDPARYQVWKSQLRDGIVRAETARAVALNLGRIHAATAGSGDIANAFANDATFFAIRLEPYFGAAGQANPDCRPALERLIETTANTKLALVHGDVSPKNILVGPDGPVLLDAECAWYGDPAFDLSFCLTHLLLKCIWLPASATAFLSCFDAFVETYSSTVAWENPAELEARGCALLAGMLLARVDGKSPVEYIDAEPDRARVRDFARRHLLSPTAHLGAMRTAWQQAIRK
jgi:aminoglycoside phosphotransferase (APT) family kinase protein